MTVRRNYFGLQGQVALITGGARGIGRSIAECLGVHGARVCIADVNADGAQACVNELIGSGIAAFDAPIDVTDSFEIDLAIRSIFADYGRLDIVINNAAISARIPAECYPNADLDRIIDINIKGVFYVMRAAAQQWIGHRSAGRIVNIASFAGLVADPLSAPYAASKGAVVQLTRSCAVEWAQHGIAVNAIAPGYVNTEMIAATLADPDESLAVRLKTPMRRVAEPHEIAAAALFLASPAASYVTGHVLCVDGGWTAV